MRGSGVHPEPAMRGSQLAGLWTAACDAGIDRIPAVFGLPFAPLKLTLYFFAIIGRRENCTLVLHLNFTSDSLLF